MKLIKKYILIMLCLFACMLMACSKKVKDKQYETSVLINEDSVSVPDELQFELSTAGPNRIIVSMSSPAFAKLFEDRKKFTEKYLAGESDSAPKKYELNIYFKKEEQIKYMLNASKFGLVFESISNDDNEKIRIFRGKTSTDWMYKDKVMEIFMAYPGISNMLEECDAYEVILCDIEENKEEKLHIEGKNKLVGSLPQKSVEWQNKMKYDVKHYDSGVTKITLSCSDFIGMYMAEVLIILDDKQNEERYIKMIPCNNFLEIDGGENYCMTDYWGKDEDGEIQIDKLCYKVEMGYVSYDNEHNRVYLPIVNENGNVCYGIVEDFFRGEFKIYIKNSQIKDIVDDYEVIWGYIGDEFEELVYVVTK